MKNDNGSTAHRAPSLCVAAAAALALYAGAGYGAVPGIKGALVANARHFDLQASAGRISQPDGMSLYAWGYGCSSAPAAFLPFRREAVHAAFCAACCSLCFPRQS